ncbi:hypothetical protein MTO96_029204 [Rhipicephalus appendiculatus]
MKNFTACFIVFAVIFMSSDWQPASNVIVEAGRVIFGYKDCWRYNCYPEACPSHCECPSPFIRFFGVKNCR